MKKPVVKKVKSPAFKAGGFTWLKTMKDQWTTDVIPGEEVAYPRIKQLDAETFSVYRDGKYLGSEPTFDKAVERARLNKMSEKNKTMQEWERKHPGTLPKGINLTAAEKAEFWRRFPPAKAPVDPAKAPKRAALAGTAPKEPKRTVDVPSTATIRVKPGATIPKHPGTAAHGRWAVLWGYDGKTVGAYAAAKGNMTTLANAIVGGYVEVEK